MIRSIYHDQGILFIGGSVMEMAIICTILAIYGIIHDICLIKAVKKY